MPRRKSSISKAQSYREIGEFWDTHDLAEQWERTQPAEFEVDLQSGMTTQQSPIAFMSYVRFDDQHDNGRLTQFRERLSGEVRVQTGEEFPIFQDRNDILWGQNWKERVEDSLDQVTFLIPIVTPSFFLSPACRNELERFIDREKQLGRNDLIMPVYYVDCPPLNDQDRRASDPLAEAVAAHQYADWRELRFEPFTSPEVGKRLAQMAVQVRNALGRVRGPVPGSGVTPSRSPRSSRRSRPAREGAEASEAVAQSVGDMARGMSGPAAKTEPPTLTVDAMGRGDYLSITEAIHAAWPGTLILVGPGFYPEGLVIDKPLEIVGDGDRQEIVVRATRMSTIRFTTTMGRVANLTLRNTSDGTHDCVEISQGRLVLEECDIASQGSDGVDISGGADPRVRRNLIHDSKPFGVLVRGDALGTLEDNDIFANGVSGVAVAGGGNPTLRRNRISGNGARAVTVVSKGGGTFEDNDLRENAHGAWDISADSEPLVKRARNQE
jgi:F-box protein 11